MEVLSNWRHLSEPEQSDMATTSQHFKCNTCHKKLNNAPGLVSVFLFAPQGSPCLRARITRHMFSP